MCTKLALFTRIFLDLVFMQFLFFKRKDMNYT